jgi:hypothetical protein
MAKTGIPEEKKDQNLMTLHVGDIHFKRIEKKLEQCKKINPKYKRSRLLRESVYSKHFKDFLKEYEAQAQKTMVNGNLMNFYVNNIYYRRIEKKVLQCKKLVPKYKRSNLLKDYVSSPYFKEFLKEYKPNAV